MYRTTTSRVALAALCALWLVGCEDGGTEGDAGSGADAGPPADSGPPTDAGPPVDSGPPMDTGPGADAGMGADAGPAMCGDRRVTAPEECDDGNRLPGDGCDASCRFETSATCGDGNVDLPGEECDDGGTVSGDGCSATCRIEAAASCGDGTLDLASGEQCDDGNRLPGDGCSPSCQFERVGAFCGDSMMDPGELCDDGNTAPADMCNPTCNFGNVTTLFAGSPGMAGATDGVGSAARFGGLGVLAADANYLWVTDPMNRRLRRIEVSTATVTTVAGDGMMRIMDAPDGANASFRGLEAIATDGTTVWIADTGFLRAVTVAAPHAVTSVAGNGMGGMAADGVGSAARFDDLRGLTYYGGYVWLLDANAATVRRFDPSTNEVITVAGMPYALGSVDGVGSAARFQSPRYMASDGSGILYIADTNGQQIRSFNTGTGEVRTFAGQFMMAGVTDGVGTAARVHRPRGITSDGTSVYFVEFNQHVIRQGVAATRSVTTMLGVAGMNGYTEGVGSASRFASPFSIAFHWPSRSLFIMDGGNNVIRRVQ